MSGYKQLYFWGAILIPNIIGLTLAQIAHQSKHSAKKTPLFGTSSDQQQKLWDLGANQSFHFRPHGLHQIIHVASSRSWGNQLYKSDVSIDAYTIHTSYYLCHVYIKTKTYPCFGLYMCIYIYINIHTYIHYFTLHCIALHGMAWHCIALHTLHYIHTYVCVSHLCIYCLYLNIYIYLYIYIYLFIYLFLYIYISIYLFIYIYIQLFF